MSKTDKRKKREKSIKESKGRDLQAEAAGNYCNSGSHLYSDGKYSEACSYFIKALNINPGFNYARFFLSLCLYRIKDYD
ncbi:MAG: hypothetical protein LWY06_14190, partial [Firmicutes bacterium]|nr:hypothetical protein [Bacillota bacterium]